MAIWSRGHRVADPDAATFRAEVEAAVEVMARHRLKAAIGHVDAAMAKVRASSLSSVDRYTVTNDLLDAKNALAGLGGGAS